MAPEFVPPGPGHWALDRSHYPHGATPISQWLLSEGFDHGFRRVFAELGLPVDSVAIEFVHGFSYTRLRPLIGADSEPRKPPPVPILKLASRLHPEFRKRNKTAIATLRDRPSNAIVHRWEKELRPELIKANTTFQNFDVHEANDVELQSHITALLDQLRSNFELHFWLHGHDLGPVARYLQASLGWGLDPIQAISALAGASPTTAEPMEVLCELRALVDAAAEPVSSLDEIRSISDEARDLLDAYLDKRGHILATGYDLDSRTLLEMPEVVLSTILTAAPVSAPNADGIAGELRNQLSVADRSVFDIRLSDARNVMDMRDDNGPLTIEWPMGLLRRALLEAGRRLVERGSIAEIEHALEVTPSEARELFAGRGPASQVLSDRATERLEQAKLEAPMTLGPIEPAPPLSALPPALAELTEMVQLAQKYIGMDGTVSSEPLSGAGIGDTRYVGIARVASSADEAIDRLQPGEILIVRATSPAFNVVLAIAGAVITSDGGVLSHAAVLARELGIPAVIGVPGALDIADGSTVEVDPAAGQIRVVT